MIYLIDTTKYKVIFDRDNTLQAYAIDREQEAQLKEWQIENMMKQADNNDKEVIVYPFHEVDEKVENKTASAIDPSISSKLALKDIFWKPIFEEKQEENLKYVEIF